MDKSVQPVRFWESVTNYSQNTMTTTQADFELRQVFECIGLNNEEAIKALYSFGVADGLREPIAILEDIEKKGHILPSKIIVNDIARNLLTEAETNLKTHGWVSKLNGDPIYILGEIDKINLEIINTTKLRLAVFGVYNLEYLAKALRLYQENVIIIGAKFNVYPVYLSSDENNLALECGQSIRFDINDLNDDIIERIHSNVDPTKELYAQCVYTTDNNFVSHYFNSKSLKKLVGCIFIGFDVNIHQDADHERYLIVKARCAKANGDGTTLITSLNNVLGNITTDAQIKSLEVLNKFLN